MNPPSVIVHSKKFSELISQDSIKQRIQELGSKITKEYTNKEPIIIGVLDGAVIFMCDLIQELQLDCQIDFIKVSSYGTSMSSSGTVSLSKDISTNLENKDIIIVEDIIETGKTLSFVRNHILQKKPNSVAIATLLHKNLCSLDFPVEYVGFNIPEEFVIGYGLDYAHYARNLKSIYALDE